jgi:hypothetical protein
MKINRSIRGIRYILFQRIIVCRLNIIVLMFYDVLSVNRPFIGGGNTLEKFDTILLLKYKPVSNADPINGLGPAI